MSSPTPLTPLSLTPTVPDASVPGPEPGGVPEFAPVRVRGGSHRLRRAVLRRRRAVAAGLAVTAAALATAGVRDAGPAGGVHSEAASGPPRARQSVEMVSAPVRIADAETVRLLRRGDRVDVIAIADSPMGGGDSDARVVARGARVTSVPKALVTAGGDSGALVVVSVPRASAAALAGAGTTSRLAVTLC
ncbi:hypothetical protein ABCR94_35795 [Streptomyces sp. 21So2-11]|uniref:hypothetical protein n=1 Tax=Streptomyces sp. 21So2-11 TaxID=3144408 RepID=UPI00321B309F